MPSLGPFELIEVIGAGGMGEIWRAEHQDNHVQVAIKVIKSAASGEFRDAFLQEVRLVAGLNHRNVIMALDAGTVPESAADASEGALVAGAPYLAMELAGGGSLAQVRIRSWKGLQHVLLELFQGLAHAHARGVVHRDIKPGNLLLAAERARLASKPKSLLSSRIVLTDFGIGTHRDGVDLFGDDAIGTPEYMAPEQIRGQWRDQGPWTDLYAAGILAFKIACGRAPFKRAGSTQTLLAHLREPVPPLEPLFEVPVGFEAFVRQLLAKKPADRFAYAGDARRALLALEDVTEASSSATRRMSAIRDIPVDPDATELPTERNTASSEVSLITGGLGSGTGTGTGTGAGSWSPQAWSDRGRRDFRLAGAGLGLYGLRTIPLVDRVAARDALWGTLVQVRAGGEARVVVLRGASGTGKSRLAEWLSWTAHEAGAGPTLKAVLSGPGSGDVLTRIARAGLRCEGLERHELIDRVTDFLGREASDADIDALVQIAAPHLSRAAPLTRKEMHAAMEGYLRRFAADRTAIVWLDDAQLSIEAVAFAQRMLKAQEGLPALIVLTVEEEALAEQPEVAALLDQLLADPLAESMSIGPLSQEDHQELVRGLLGLEGSLALQVEQKTVGNPLFAVQLVGEWIARGLLIPSERGFRLAPGADADIPDTVLAVWDERITRFLDTRSDDDGRALELGATLGLELRQIDFRRCCRMAGISPSLDLIDALMKRGLAQPVDERGRFALIHGKVRAVLLRRARAGGRLAAHNRATAAYLESTPHLADPERLAGLHLAAGDLERALDPLDKAISTRLAAGDFRSSSLIADLEGALKTLALPDTDPRWGELWLSWAWLFRVRGQLTDAERWTVRAERAARRHHWNPVLAKALRLGARIERNLGHVDQALEMIDEAEITFATLGDRSRAASCRVLAGDLWMSRSELDRATACFRSAVGASDDPQDEVEAWMGLAHCAQRQRDTAAFTHALDRARNAAVQAGRRSTLAAIANLQGELARQGGDLELAETFYREATRRYRALDDGGYVYSQLNVGLLLVMRDAWADAVTLIEPLRERSERGGVESVPACFARVVLLPCSAGLGDWSSFKGHYKWLKRYLAANAVLDGDIAAMAARAGELALEQGRPDGALAGYQLALAQYQGLNQPEQAALIEGKLSLLR